MIRTDGVHTIAHYPAATIEHEQAERALRIVLRREKLMQQRQAELVLALKDKAAA